MFDETYNQYKKFFSNRIFGLTWAVLFWFIKFNFKRSRITHLIIIMVPLPIDKKLSALSFENYENMWERWSVSINNRKKQFHFNVIRNCIVVDTSQLWNGMKHFVFNRVYTYYIIKKYFWMNGIYYAVDIK